MSSLHAEKITLARLAISLVWLYQGLWCKVLGRIPRHAKVVESSPLFDARSAHYFLILLGWFETLLSVWVLSGRYTQVGATVQISLLIVMNTGGLLWARKIIPDPAGMVFQNFAFAMLIWICR